MKKEMVSLCTIIMTLSSAAFGYNYVITNNTESHLTALINLAGREPNPTLAFEILPYKEARDSGGIFCASNVIITAQDGELMGQETQYSLGGSPCRNICLRVYRMNKALQVESITGDQCKS